MNPYAVLGLNQNSSLDDVERAYRKLALQFHPDRNPGDSEAASKFRDIQEAYDRIKKPENFRNEQNFQEGFQSPFDIIFPFFNEDPNILMNITLNVQEAYFGINKTIHVPRKQICNMCQGTRFKQTILCGSCGGQGFLKKGNNHLRCKECSGTGKLGTHKCDNCHATGHIKINAELTVTFPPGLKDNSVVRLQGAGHQFRQFVGDLLIKLKIISFNKFHLLNDELHTSIELPLTKFILGGEVEITDIENQVISVKILPNTPSGTKLRVKNKGMKIAGTNDKTDLVATINVQIPDITDVNVISKLKEFGI